MVPTNTAMTAVRPTARREIIGPPGIANARIMRPVIDARRKFCALPAAVLAGVICIDAAVTPTGLLRISVVVLDGDGNKVPVPRAQLLISDNPSTREPRRVRTGADGTVEITLPAGNYTVESDLPVRLGARVFAWTRTLDVVAG